MNENVLVTGATGKVGRELVGRLVERGSPVRAGTRFPDEARALFPDEVEVVELDYERADTWDGAVHWADRVFLMPAPFDPAHHAMLRPFMDWAVSSDSRHVVLLSAMAADRVDDLHLRKMEKHLSETGVAWTFLRPNWFMQNFTRGYVLECIRAEDSFALPAGEGKVSFVDSRDVAEVAYEVLTCDDHFGAAYTLTGPAALDHFEAAGVVSEAAGRPVKYEPVSDEVFRTILRERGRSEEEREVIVEAYRSMRDGWRAEVTDSVEEIVGREPVSFRDFATEHSEVWV